MQTCQSLADQLHTLRHDFKRSEGILEDTLPEINYKVAQSCQQIRKKQANAPAHQKQHLNLRDKFHVSTYCDITDTPEANMKRSEMYVKKYQVD